MNDAIGTGSHPADEPDRPPLEAYAGDFAPQRVVFKLRANAVPDSYEDGLESLLPQAVAEAWDSLVKDYSQLAPYLTIERVFHGQLGQPGEPGAARRELRAFYEVTLPANAGQTVQSGICGAIVDRMQQFRTSFEDVYLASPQAEVPQNPCGKQDTYLTSMGMRMTRAQTADGVPTASRAALGGKWPRIVHLERIYVPNDEKLSHDELADIGVIRGQGGPTRAEYKNDAVFDDDMSHAVKVLAILGGQGKPPHCQGLVPASQVFFASALVKDQAGQWVQRIADQIEMLTNPNNHCMEAGDILLIEMQSYGWLKGKGGCSPNGWNPSDKERVFVPVELERDVHEALIDARTRGIIVIEPVGNGGQDLKDLVSYCRCLPLDVDTGAILTAACDIPLSTGHKAHMSTNYGDRVVCYSWGADIVTVRPGEKGVMALSAKSPTIEFDKTSGAATLVAGIAAQVQHQAMSTPGLNRFLTPSEMRAALTTVASGAAPMIGTKKIGVLPNLEAIKSKYLPGMKKQ